MSYRLTRSLKLRAVFSSCGARACLHIRVWPGTVSQPRDKAKGEGFPRHPGFRNKPWPVKHHQYMVLKIAKRIWYPTCPAGLIHLAEEGNRVLKRTIMQFAGNTADELLGELHKQVVKGGAKKRGQTLAEHPRTHTTPATRNPARLVK